jgi:hypothetical protein
MRKDTISEEVMDTIHWEAVGDTMQAVPRKRRVFISKHTCGMCGVGKFMHFFLVEALSNQASIGWRRFFEGWLSIEWALAQQAYYSLIKSHRTGKRWVVSLIKKLWDIAWDLWEHRNGILHEDTNLVSDAELRTIDRNIRNSFLHLRSISLPAHDRHLLSISLPRLLRKDHAYKSEWLCLATLVLRSKAHEQWIRRTSNALLIRGMQHGMQHFLNRRIG